MLDVEELDKDWWEKESQILEEEKTVTIDVSKDRGNVTIENRNCMSCESGETYMNGEVHCKYHDMWFASFSLCDMYISNRA